MAVLKGQMPLQYFLGQTLRTVAIDGETRASAIKGSSTGCHSWHQDWEAVPSTALSNALSIDVWCLAA